MKEADLDRTVLASNSWELGKNSEESDIIDMEDLSWRVNREKNFFSEGLLSVRHGSTCFTYLSI